MGTEFCPQCNAKLITIHTNEIIKYCCSACKRYERTEMHEYNVPIRIRCIPWTQKNSKHIS